MVMILTFRLGSEQILECETEITFRTSSLGPEPLVESHVIFSERDITGPGNETDNPI